MNIIDNRYYSNKLDKLKIDIINILFKLFFI